jgi:hypothetical protein
MLESLATSSTLKASADGPIVITLPPALTIIFYRLKASEAGSIVITLARLTLTIPKAQSIRSRL